MARQPILDVQRNVFGYELLFRAGPENIFAEGSYDGDRATASVMTHAMDRRDLAKLTNGRKCFVNITRRVLLDEMYTVLSPDHVVLELLENIEPDADVLRACHRLRQAGYMLALDDYAMDEHLKPFLTVINLLKVDFMALDFEQRRAAAQRAAGYGVRTIAEKVETYQDFAQAVDMGYTYFQGYFFCKPEMLSRRELPVVKRTYAQLLQQINASELNHDVLERLIRSDLGLSYKLLRLLNSAAFSFRNEITSIRRGLVLLGERPLRKWASLIVMGALCDEKPEELFYAYMIRARACENLAAAIGMEDRRHDLFILGMFSLLDAILDQPMPEALRSLALGEDVKAALLGRPNQLRDLLNLVIAFERGQWARISSGCRTLGLSDEEIAEAHQEAIAWASSLGKHCADHAAAAA